MCTWTLIVNLFVWTNHWKWKHTKLWPSWFPNHIRLDRIPSNQVCAMEHILYCLGFPDHIRLDRVPSNQVCAMEHILYSLGFPNHIRLDRVPSNQVCAMEPIYLLSLPAYPISCPYRFRKLWLYLPESLCSPEPSSFVRNRQLLWKPARKQPRNRIHRTNTTVTSF